jgi:hypothetical protein
MKRDLNKLRFSASTPITAHLNPYLIVTNCCFTTQKMVFIVQCSTAIIYFFCFVIFNLFKNLLICSFSGMFYTFFNLIKLAFEKSQIQMKFKSDLLISLKVCCELFLVLLLIDCLDKVSRQYLSAKFQYFFNIFLGISMKVRIKYHDLP